MHLKLKHFVPCFQLAIEHGIKFMETSAKASINVEEAFFTLARDIKLKMDRKQVRLSLHLATVFNYLLAFCWQRYFSKYLDLVYLIELFLVPAVVCAILSVGWCI